jgi:hypothetical protein
MHVPGQSYLVLIKHAWSRAIFVYSSNLKELTGSNLSGNLSQGDITGGKIMIYTPCCRSFSRFILINRYQVLEQAGSLVVLCRVL